MVLLIKFHERYPLTSSEASSKVLKEWVFVRINFVPIQEGTCTNTAILNNIQIWCSLIPSPSPPPVFDGFQYVNIEGEGLGDLVMCGDDM